MTIDSRDDGRPRPEVWVVAVEVYGRNARPICVLEGTEDAVLREIERLRMEWFEATAARWWNPEETTAVLPPEKVRELNLTAYRRSVTWIRSKHVVRHVS
jgi:hypothetical protein